MCSCRYHLPGDIVSFDCVVHTISHMDDRFNFMKSLSDSAVEYSVQVRTAPGHDENYLAFLLRLWRSNSGHPWHASLIPVGAEDQVRHFGDLEELLAYLQSVS